MGGGGENGDNDNGGQQPLGGIQAGGGEDGTMKANEVHEIKNIGVAVEDVKQRAGMMSSTSRTWIMAYCFLTWLVTAVFFVLVVLAYGGSVDQSIDNDKPKRGIVQSMGCLSKQSFLHWNRVFDLYENFHKNVNMGGLGAVGTLEVNLLTNALVAMNCSIGIGSQDVTFAYTSLQCSCTKYAHEQYFRPRIQEYASSATLSSEDKISKIREYGEMFSTKGGAKGSLVGQYFDSLMVSCFFAHRPAQWIEYQPACATQVVPFSMAMYVNTIAGCFAGKSFCVHLCITLSFEECIFTSNFDSWV
jgi:hypothetical protein